MENVKSKLVTNTVSNYTELKAQEETKKLKNGRSLLNYEITIVDHSSVKPKKTILDNEMRNLIGIISDAVEKTNSKAIPCNLKIRLKYNQRDTAEVIEIPILPLPLERIIFDDDFGYKMSFFVSDESTKQKVEKIKKQDPGQFERDKAKQRNIIVEHLTKVLLTKYYESKLLKNSKFEDLLKNSFILKDYELDKIKPITIPSEVKYCDHIDGSLDYYQSCIVEAVNKSLKNNGSGAYTSLGEICGIYGVKPKTQISSLGFLDSECEAYSSMFISNYLKNFVLPQYENGKVYNESQPGE